MYSIIFGANYIAHKKTDCFVTVRTEAQFVYFTGEIFISIFFEFRPALLSDLDVGKCVVLPPLGVRVMGLLFQVQCMLNLSPLGAEYTPLSLLGVLSPPPSGASCSPTRV